MNTTPEKTNASNYEPVTIETLEKTARAAAYVAIRKAYLATARKVTDNAGNVVDYDGNSGGADIIRRLYYGFSATTAAARAAMDAAAAAYDAAPDKATAATAAAAALAYAEAVGNDTDDCIQVAMLSLWENIAANGGKTGTDTAFMDAVRAVHRYIYQQDKNTSTKVRRRYNDRGELLAMDDYQYIKYPHIYIDAYDGTDSGGNATFDVVDVNDDLAKYIRGQRDNDTINEVLPLLTATQKRVLKYVAQGYTYETVAARLNITQAAARKHMQRIREKAATVER